MCSTAAWWALRPVFVLVLIVLMLPFLAIFGRYESGSRRAAAPAGLVQAGLGAVIACGGLTMVALSGISLDRLPGFNWIAGLLIIAGVTLATRALPFGKAAD